MQQNARESISQTVQSYSLTAPQSYSHDLAPSDFHLFGALRGHRFQSNEEVDMTVREWLRKQEPYFYGDGIFKLVPKWNKCTNVIGDYAEK
jgi:hypothetical protein